MGLAERPNVDGELPVRRIRSERRLTFGHGRVNQSQTAPAAASASRRARKSGFAPSFGGQRPLKRAPKPDASAVERTRVSEMVEVDGFEPP